MKKILLIVICFTLLCSCTSTKNMDMSPKLVSVKSGNIGQITSQCLPTVVAISCSLYNGQSVGSGVCVGKDGLILTNNHVVEGANSIHLYLANGKRTTAKLLWHDKGLDLAILRSKMALPWLDIAQSGDYNIGDEVIAIGTPIDLNFKHSVTHGVISALNRTLQVDDGVYSQMTHLLQHDASINPGNSGGPLINSNGEIIGINTIKVENAEGMGFAVVCDTILPVLKNFIDTGHHSNGYLGMFGYDVSLEEFGSEEYGLKIVSLTENSPLNQFNVKKGDIITKINGKKIKDYLMLKKELYKHKSGENVDLEIKQDDNFINISVTLL